MPSLRGKIKGRSLFKKEKEMEVMKKRMANLELLRCLAMLMVVVLHYLGKGGLLEFTGSRDVSVTISAWLLEALCIVAVNVYMLISGYFLSASSFKTERLLKLWGQVWFYSVAAGLAGALLGLVPAGELNTHYFLTLLFPVSMKHYWFMTAYIFLYLLLPLLGRGLARMTKRQHQLTVLFLLFTFCLLKSVLPVRLETDGQGYDCIWYLCVFTAAAYIRRFGISFLESKKRCLILYLGGCLAALGELLLLHGIYLRTGSFELIWKISMEYNHIFPFLASVGLFGFFLRLRPSGKTASLAVKTAPYALGVYLLHENIGFRYVWQKWLWADKADTVLSLLFLTFLASACVFACGVLTDMLRTLLMKGLWLFAGRLAWGRAFADKIKAVDLAFAGRVCEKEAVVGKES